MNNQTLVDFRNRAQNMSLHEGMVDLIKYFPLGNQLESWTDTMWDCVTQVRYEDLLRDFPSAFRSLFGAIAADWPDEMIHDIQELTSFSRMSGRMDGSEDKTSHFRKGQSGDWKNYFNDTLSKAFYDRYGWMGERLGYW